MNFTYFKFLFINTIKRKPVWITWLLFLFTCTCFIIILPLAANMNTLQVWANTTMTICQTFLGMTVSIFTAVLAINIFKDTNEEGTELIIVSKPITRFKIVLTKFLVFGFFCLVVNITACLITMFTIFLPRTEVKFYWGLVLSMFIGNAVTFAVFGSIAILTTVNFAKVGIVITNIALSLVFLIYQALTLFVFSTPAKALVDSRMAAPSYITIDRKPDGNYREKAIVNFTATPVEKKLHDCQATNWREMQQFWTSYILGKDPSKALTATDLAGQISSTYLSYGINEYSQRQASRMFAASRFYDYVLTSPASPEILNVENKQSLSWMYTGKTTIEDEETGIEISIPSSVGYFAIKPVTVTRLKGYSYQIPIGYVKSKELLSEREVFFEKEEWDKYKEPFDLIYDRIFDKSQYIDLVPTSLYSEDYTDYASLFDDNTDTESRFYELIWNCFVGGSKSLLKDDEGKLIYDITSFDIKTIDGLNDRFMQFKYYAFFKAMQEQQALLTTNPKGLYVPESREAALTQMRLIARMLDIEYSDEGWMMKASSDDCVVIEPNTQTVSYNLIDTAWTNEKTILDNVTPALSEDEKIDYAVASPKGVMNKTQAIFNAISNPNERFLFDSMIYPTRNAKYNGEIHTTKSDWIPYLATLIAPMYDPEQLPDKTNSLPIGHNMSMFFFVTKPKINYWTFAILWAIISIGLMAGGIVVYNKYDVK